MRTYSLGFLALILVSMSSCGGSESPTETTDPPTPVATTLTLSPTSVSFSALGATEQLTATVLDQNGATMTGASVAWTSSLSSVATVSTSGVVQAESSGFATITASAGSINATAAATVEQVVAVIALSPDSILIAAGQTVTVAATSTDAGGSVVSDATLRWFSSDESVAVVSDAGVVTGVSGGVTVVRAEADGGAQTASAEIPVVVGPFSFVNGGFDTDATGWAFVGNDGSGGYRASGGFPDGGFARLNAAGACGSDPSVSQQIDGFGVGVSYTIRGVYRPYAPSFGSASAESFVIRVGGAIVLQLARGPVDVWTAFEATFTATSANALVEFLSEFGCDDSSYDLDNVSFEVTP